MSFKVNDIRPEKLMEAKKALLEEDKEFLRSRKKEFVKINCPACGSEERKFWAEKEGFTYDICKICKTVYMNPRASKELMHIFYRQSKNYEFWNKHIFPASEKTRKEKIFRPRAEKVIDYCKKFNIKGGILLEVGAGFGTFCEVIREYNFFKEIIAVEPTPDLAETCRKRGFNVYESPVENLDLPEESIEVVANFEVIEHLFDPESFIRDCIKYLKKDGLFICTCPNIESIGTLIIKEKTNTIDHEHVNAFNPSSLSLLLEKLGLKVMEVSTPGELDTDILKSEFDKDEKLCSGHPFLKYLLLKRENETLKEFQNFIKKVKLSSHMWIVGRKK